MVGDLPGCPLLVASSDYMHIRRCRHNWRTLRHGDLPPGDCQGHRSRDAEIRGNDITQRPGSGLRGGRIVIHAGHAGRGPGTTAAGRDRQRAGRARGHAGSTTSRTPELLRGMYLSFQNCDRLSRLSKPDRAEFLEMSCGIGLATDVICVSAGSPGMRCCSFRCSCVPRGCTRNERARRRWSSRKRIAA